MSKLTVPCYLRELNRLAGYQKRVGVTSLSEPSPQLSEYGVLSTTRPSPDRIVLPGRGRCETAPQENGQGKKQHTAQHNWPVPIIRCSARNLPGLRRFNPQPLPYQLAGTQYSRRHSYFERLAVPSVLPSWAT